MKKADSFKFKAMTGLTCSERNPGRAREGFVTHRRVMFLTLMLALLLINGTDLRAQIALRGTATSATTTNTPLTINKPAGVVAGDVMIVNITYTNPNTYTDASLTGWTLVAGARQSTGTRYSTVLYRVAGGSEGTSYTFSLPAGTTSAVGSIIAFSGVDASVLDVPAGSFNTTLDDGTSPYQLTATGITTFTNNAAVVFLAGAGGTDGFIYSSWSGTNPTFTEVMDFSTTTTTNSVGAAWGIRATAGATGNRTVNVDNYYYQAGILIALKPRPPISITTGTITGAPFCVSSGSGASVSVPFTSVGTFTGNTYTAELSSSTGVFPGTNIGTLVSNSNSGTISATIPAGTASGTGYLIRVISSSPAITGSSSSALEIINGAANVSSPAAAGGNTQATLSWTNPSGCFDEIMIIAQAGSAVTTSPSGDGSSYTASLAFGSGTAFDGGFVVYKGSTTPQTVTALTNGTTYYFTLFTRFGSTWSTGTTVTAVPSLATTGDYRSNAATMNWNTTTSGQWQSYDGSSWVNTTTPPTSSNANIITIRNGHTVTVTAAVSVDQVVVESGGKVTVNNVTMTIANGTGDDFVVNGTVELTGTNGVITPTGNLIFNAGSTYIHNRTTNGGIIPTATWDPSSTCVITGLTSGLGTLAGVTQTFGNVTFNCPLLTSWGGDLPDTQRPVAILGDLTMIASGASGAERDFGLCNGDGATQSLSIGGDLIITGGIYRISYRNNVTHHIAGDIIITGGSLLMNSTETGTGQSGIGTINVNGNVEITSGTLNFGQSGRCDADDNGILNISGNFTHSGGTITEEGGATGDVINFAGTTIQTYTSGGTVANLVNFNVNSGAILYMGTSLLGNGSAGTFTLANGGTLGIGDAAGITTSGATGNIRVSGTRTYNTGANYIYNGTAAQDTGNGLPATVNSLVFNNPGGAVTFTAVCAVTNDFSITSGSIANLGAFSHTAGTLTLGGVVQPGCTYGSSTSSAAFKNNTFFAGTGIVTTGACASGMWLGGSADWNTTTNWFGGTVPGSGTDVIITSAAPNQPVVNVSPVAVCNNLTISSGSSMTINPGQALTVNGNLANSGTFTITSDAVNNNGSLIVNGSSAGTVTYNRFMPAGSSWHYVSSPVSLTSSPSGSFYGWNEVAGDWDAGTTATPASGIGYTLQTAGTAVSFTGSVVNSVSPISATSPYSDCDFPGGTALYSGRTYASGRNATTAYGGGGWNLLGNPFTSALNVNGTGGFIAGNIGSFDPNYVAVYIYDGASYSFIGSQIPGWEETTTGFGDDNVQVGQGFFLLSHCNASTFSFTPGMQTHDISVPMTKSARTEDSPWPGLLLKVKYGDKENSTLVVYNEKMTADLDPGYDVGQLSNGPDVEIYTSLPIADNGVSFARQALPIANADTIIVPLGIDTEAGGEVTFSSTTVPLGSNKFWLEDRKSGKFTDLSTGTYTVTLPAKTYGTGRFFIIASTNTPTGIRQPQTEDTGVRVWTSNEKVIIQGEVSDRAICEVYNVNGKKILRIRLTGGEMNTVNLPYGLKGAFIVRVADGAKVTTRKVALL